MLEVASNDFEDEVDFTIEHMTFPDERERGDMLFEGAKIFLGLALQADHRKYGDAIAQSPGIKFGMIALDRSAVFKGTDTPQTGWCS